MNSYDTEDAIFALATAYSKSAIAVVRVSGKDCIKTLSKAIKSKSDICTLQSNYALFCHLINPKDSRLIDQIVLTLYKDGHGYTGEEAFEISCHGGLEVVKAVLDTMKNLGFRQALAGEFTLRAFLHGKIDLTQAEAVDELVNAQGSKARLMALGRLNGALNRRIKKIKDIVLDIMSTVEVQLDYSEDEIGEDLTFPISKLEGAIVAIKTLCDTYNTARLYSQGARIVLAGPSNAGKSSLFNLFLKEDRSIVSSQAGTTRDFIEAMCIIDDIPVRLFDTAGFRENSDNEIEIEGIRRSKNLIDSAAIIIYMLDASEIKEVDENLIKDPRCIPVLNKSDLYSVTKDSFMNLSVATGEGFDKLCSEISKRLKGNSISLDDTTLVIENARQKENLENALSSLENAKSAVISEIPLDLVAIDIQNALKNLGELTGEVTTDDILDRIFGSFCVGK